MRLKATLSLYFILQCETYFMNNPGLGLNYVIQPLIHILHSQRLKMLPRSRSRSGPSGGSLFFDQTDSSSVQIRSVQLFDGVIQATTLAKFNDSGNEKHFNFKIRITSRSIKQSIRHFMV